MGLFPLVICQNSYGTSPSIMDLPIEHSDFPYSYVELPKSKPICHNFGEPTEPTNGYINFGGYKSVDDLVLG